MDIPPEWHDQAQWECEAAYAAGYAAGREAEAADWMAIFAGVLARDPSVTSVREGMARHLRQVDGWDRFAAMIRGELAPDRPERTDNDGGASTRVNPRWPSVRDAHVPGARRGGRHG